MSTSSRRSAPASGFLVKDTGAAELLRAVRVVAGGEALLSPGVTRRLIAAQLYVTSSTAKTHANRAMAKLRARDRAQLVVFAYQAGLARPGWTG